MADYLTNCLKCLSIAIHTDMSSTANGSAQFQYSCIAFAYKSKWLEEPLTATYLNGSPCPYYVPHGAGPFNPALNITKKSSNELDPKMQKLKQKAEAWAYDLDLRTCIMCGRHYKGEDEEFCTPCYEKMLHFMCRRVKFKEDEPSKPRPKIGQRKIQKGALIDERHI